MDDASKRAQSDPRDNGQCNLVDHLARMAGDNGRAENPVGPFLDVDLHEADFLAVGDRAIHVVHGHGEGFHRDILIASGAEVGLIVAAAERLGAEGVGVRCVSMPSWELFDALPQVERDSVLPPDVQARLAVEAGVAQGWHRYVGDAGGVLSVERFGASAPGEVVLREYGFNVEEVCKRARALLR